MLSHHPLPMPTDTANQWTPLKKKDTIMAHHQSFCGRQHFEGCFAIFLPRSLKPRARGGGRARCHARSARFWISTFTNKVRHSRITHNPHSFIAFVHLPCVLGLKGLQGIPTPETGDQVFLGEYPASACAVCTQRKNLALVCDTPQPPPPPGFER